MLQPQLIARHTIFSDRFSSQEFFSLLSAIFCLQWFDAVGWAAGRASGVVEVGAPLVRLGWHPSGLNRYLCLHYLPLLHKNPEDRRWGNPA